jgi:drug/metabolite transporter (DMT)-like permease
MIKTLFVMGLAVVAGVVGDLFLSKGMKDLGDVSTLRLHHMFAFILRVIKAPKIWIGTFCLSAFFFLWLTVLSWEKLSIALPLQAGTFILGPLMAKIYLGESIPRLRWFGILLISIGVILVVQK